METLNSKLAEFLEEDEIGDDDVLRDFDLWDSLTVLSILAMLDKTYGINIVATDLVKVETVKDLNNLVNSLAK